MADAMNRALRSHGLWRRPPNRPYHLDLDLIVVIACAGLSALVQLSRHLRRIRSSIENSNALLYNLRARLSPTPSLPLRAHFHHRRKEPHSRYLFQLRRWLDNPQFVSNLCLRELQAPQLKIEDACPVISEKPKNVHVFEFSI